MGDHANLALRNPQSLGELHARKIRSLGAVVEGKLAGRVPDRDTIVGFRAYVADPLGYETVFKDIVRLSKGLLHVSHIIG